uniref:Uncharacterized protein n=1 Tax=Anguilla anguilla TaxID=7936 RepID=A0A0E9SDM8_ANGAN
MSKFTNELYKNGNPHTAQEPWISTLHNECTGSLYFCVNLTSNAGHRTFFF